MYKLILNILALSIADSGKVYHAVSEAIFTMIETDFAVTVGFLYHI